MVLDLDEGHKAEKKQARKYSKGESTESLWFSFFCSTVTSAALNPVGGLSRSHQTTQDISLPLFCQDSFCIHHSGPNRLCLDKEALIILEHTDHAPSENFPLRISGVLWQLESYLEVWYFQLVLQDAVLLTTAKREYLIWECTVTYNKRPQCIQVKLFFVCLALFFQEKNTHLPYCSSADKSGCILEMEPHFPCQ